MGTVYLLHFTTPYKHARHYRGWTTDLEARLALHRAGKGARLMTVIRDAGIGFFVAKTELGTRARERQLKQRGAVRDCPVCMAQRVTQAAARRRPERLELAA
jgi:predicted GIY-YIG superfamily endonuclease